MPKSADEPSPDKEPFVKILDKGSFDRARDQRPRAKVPTTNLGECGSKLVVSEPCPFGLVGRFYARLGGVGGN